MPQLLPNCNELSNCNDTEAVSRRVTVWQREDVRPTFADNLDSQIRFQHTTKAELARRTGIKPGTITRYRTEGRMPGGPELIAIAKVLEADPEKLLGSDALEIKPPQVVRKPGRQPGPQPERQRALAKGVGAILGKPTPTGEAAPESPPSDPDPDTSPVVRSRRRPRS